MNIEFLIDENLPFELLNLFSKKNISSSHLKKIGKTGIKNGEVYNLAQERNLWIITRDSDFENYLNFASYDVGGIIVLKLEKTNTTYLMKTLGKFLSQHKDKLDKKRLIIIQDNKIIIYD